MNIRALLGILISLVVVVHCAGESDFSSQDQGSESPFINDFAISETADIPTAYINDAIDILFVIDNSNTMEAEQDNLIQNFPKMIDVIDGITPKIKDYRIGVVTTDVGAGIYTYEGSSCKLGGDGAKLVSEGCNKSFGNYLQGPSTTLSDDFACIAKVGLNGCGFEQQFKAALMAIEGQPANDGFIRKNAPIAIIFISDEDDCSAPDSFFNPDDASLGSLKSRCAAHRDKLEPVSKYITAIKALKDNPRRIVVAAITGPAGEVVIDESQFAGQVPVCSSQSFGDVAAGNRFVELVSAFGEFGVHISLCNEDLASGLEVIGKAIARIYID